MTKGEKQGHQGSGRPLKKFSVGGDSGPIEDRVAYEQRLDALPPGQKELAQESVRLADLCQYFSQQQMDLPVEVLEQIGSLSKLAIPDRIRALTNINQALMEYLNDVGEDPQVRQ